MDEKNKKKRSFFAEKGSYIALFICVAIVGVASWLLLSRSIGLNEDRETMSVVNEGGYDVRDVIKVMEKDPEPENEAEPEAQAEETEDTSAGEFGETPEPEGVKKEAAGEEKPPEDSGDDDAEDTAVTVRYIWPLAGSVEVAYSMNDLIFDKTMADWRTHDGVDIEARPGTRVLASADGTVEKVYDDEMYGTTVVIKHPDGMRSVYSNLAGKPPVKSGDAVNCGDVIGSVGNTAAAETGEVNHLHFAMKLENKSVDPTEYLPKR
ncbi:MAG: M23 family metallopeptidase [Oscillospiraceae bacterium]|nr:M23 family metallopeptidase [Oscillospiraceae bacterium]